MGTYKPSPSNLKLAAFTVFSGQTLEEALQKEPVPWPADRVVALMQNIATTIAGLHTQVGAHGGLNPRNIRFDASGRVILDNFGRFRDESDPLPPPDLVAARYLTPEQSLGDLPNAQSDIYALGSLSFELLTGKPLFDGADVEKILHQHRTATLPSACALRPELSSEIDPVLARALARDPRARFHLVKHLADEMKRALVPEQDASQQETPAQTAPAQSPATQAQAAPIATKLLPQNSAPPPTSAPKPTAQTQNADTQQSGTQPRDAGQFSQPIEQKPLQNDALQIPEKPASAPPAAVAPASAAKVKEAAKSAAVAGQNSAARQTPLSAVGATRSPGTEMWSAPPPPPPPPPPRRRQVPAILVSLLVIGGMIWGIRHQPAPPRYQTDQKELARLRKDYIQAKPPKLLPFPEEAQKTGLLKKVLLTDYLSLLVEQYKGLYLGLFGQLEDAKKKAGEAEKEAKRLRSEVRQAKKQTQQQLRGVQGQLASAQAEAVKARAAVNSAKRSVDAAQGKMNYFQSEYARVKSSMPLDPAGAITGQP